MFNLVIKLYETERKIEENYLFLVNLELTNNYDIDLYNYYKRLIYQGIEEEKRLIITLQEEVSSKDLIKILKKSNPHDEEKLISLGFIPNSFYFRLENLFKTTCGGEIIEYSDVLKYDILKLVIACLNSIINDEYFSSIKQYLIRYEYNLIFMNAYIEDDFLRDSLNNDIRIEHNNLKQDIMGTDIIDRALLASESIENILDIGNNIMSNIKDNTDDFAYATIKIINVLVRALLSQGKNLDLIMPEYEALRIESDLSELCHNLENVLNEVKNYVKTR